MKLIELKTRAFNDTLFGFGRESHVLITNTIDINNPLCERFNDARTPYEQYCAGERYLKYDNETLCSRAAHEYMINESRYWMFPKKNLNLKL